MGFVRKASPPPPPDAGQVSASGDDFPDRWPAVWEYLTQTRFEDGSVRQTATLMLTLDDGTFKGCLNDRANQRSAWVSGRSPYSVLDALELRIREDSLEWRKNQYSGRRR